MYKNLFSNNKFKIQRINRRTYVENDIFGSNNIWIDQNHWRKTKPYRYRRQMTSTFLYNMQICETYLMTCIHKICLECFGYINKYAGIFSFCILTSIACLKGCYQTCFKALQYVLCIFLAKKILLTLVF